MSEKQESKNWTNDGDLHLVKIGEYLRKKHRIPKPTENHDMANLIYAASPSKEFLEITEIAESITEGLQIAGDDGKKEDDILKKFEAAIKPDPYDFRVPEGWTIKDAYKLADTAYYLYGVAKEYRLDAKGIVADYALAVGLHPHEGNPAIARAFEDSITDLKLHGSCRNLPEITGEQLLKEAHKLSLKRKARGEWAFNA